MFSTQRGCWSVGSDCTSPVIIPTPVLRSNDCELCSRRPAEAGRDSLAREIVAGVRYVGSQRWLWISLLAAAGWLLIYVGPLEVLLPFLVKNEIGAGARGLGWFSIGLGLA